MHTRTYKDTAAVIGLLAVLVVLLTPPLVNAQTGCRTIFQTGCVTPPSCCSPLTCYRSSVPGDTGTCVSSLPPPPGPSLITLTNPLSGTSDVRGLIERFVTILRDFATPIAVFMILLGAFRILTAAGDPAKFEMGKKILLYTAIGYAIIFVGWGITSIIESLLST